MKDHRPIWKALANKKDFDSKDVEQLCIIRALVAKNPDKVAVAVALLQSAFSPITNSNRLSNGCTPYHILTTIWGSGGVNRAHPLNQCFETLEEKALYANTKREALKIMGKELGEYHTFIVVRQDISPEQQMVQFGHAVATMAYDVGKEHSMDEESKEHLELKFPEDVRVHELNFVVCGVKNKEEVEGAAEYIHSCGYTVHKFYESDLNNELTAVASGPVPSHRRHFMRRYKLLKFK